MWKLALIFTLFTFSVANSQGTAKPTYVLIPTGDVVLAVASQPDCPLRLDNPRLLFNLTKGQLEYDYDLRNVGKKSIASFVTEIWRLNGTGGTLHDYRNDKRRLLRPGARFLSDEYKDATFVPYTDDVRTKFKIGDHTRMLILLVVREVWFRDGTKYDANKDVDRIRAFFEKLGDTAEILN